MSGDIFNKLAAQSIVGQRRLYYVKENQVNGNAAKRKHKEKGQ
jgi:hypothetical protein